MVNRDKREVDILLLGGILLTLNTDMEVYDNGGIAIKGDKILDIGARDEIEGAYAAKKVINTHGYLIMPGLVNAHTHAAMVIFRGLADDLPLMDWLNHYIFPVERNLTPEIVYQGTRLAIAEMISSGTTTFCDMYLFEQEVARAVKETGLRAVVGEVLYDFPSPNYGPPEEGLKYTERLILEWQGDPLVNPAVEPHASFTCSPDLLKSCKDLSDRFRVPFIIHLAETQDEVQQVLNQYGKTPVRHLDSIGVLGKRVIANHSVWLDDEEIEIYRDRGVKVVHNPESNMKLASGVSPVTKFLSKGVPLALGTDGCASNNNLDMFEEMDTMAKLHKVFLEDPTVMNAPTTLRLATIGGAAVLGLEDQIGSIEKGKKADVIVLDFQKPHLIPQYNVYSHLVYSANGSDVNTAIVNGKILMENRRLLTIELEEVIESIQNISADISRLVRS